MKIVTAPSLYEPIWMPSLFIAGGISDCFDWQGEFLRMLADLSIVCLNPRRDSFDLLDKSVSVQQIKWEHNYLNTCDAVAFWFCSDTVCPITLFELGKMLAKKHTAPKQLFIGTDPAYSRRLQL